MNTAHEIDMLHKNGGVFRASDALRLGIHPRSLYQLRDEGSIETLSRGLYRLASLPPLTHPDLVIVAMRVPHAVVCLISALSYYDSTTEIPHEVHVALPRGTKSPKIDFPPMRVFRFSGHALTDGIQTVSIDGVDVQIYSLAKTVVDCFRFRNKIGIDIAIEGLRNAIRRYDVRAAEILEYAQRCNVETVILPYIKSIT